jgi:uncharacterized membrane protein YgdD (TMEM256/DUF423 family)
MTSVAKKIAVASAFLGALTVVLGAFGAHGLEKIVDQEAIASYQTGVRYQMYHVLLLLLLTVLPGLSDKILRQLCWLFFGGIALFSGSIYLLALDQAMGVSLSFLGPVTPIGGLLLIAGWLRLGFGLLTIRRG